MARAVASAVALASAGVAALEQAGLGADTHAVELRRFSDSPPASSTGIRRLLADRRDLLGEAVARAPATMAAMAAAIAGADDFATWTEYSASEWARPFLGRVAAAFLVGPSAPVFDDQLSFGMFVVAPDVFYPEHGHPAREVYLVVSGETEFLSAGGWRSLRAGEASVQEPEVTHALRTGSQGMLCFWAWTGDVRSPIWGFTDQGKRFTPHRRDQ